MYKQAAIFLLSSSLFMAGCGGGSGDDSSTSPPSDAVVISDQTTADNIVNTILGMETNGTTSLSSLPVGIALSTESPSVNPSDIGITAKQLADLALSMDTTTPNTFAGVTSTFSIDCDLYTNNTTGTISLTANVANDSYPSVGDTISISFNNCYSAVDTNLMNGALSLTITKIISVNPDNTLGDYSASLDISNLKSTDTLTGNYSAVDGLLSATFTGDGTNTPAVTSASSSSYTVETMTANVTQTVIYSNFSLVDTEWLDGSLSIDHDYTISCACIGGSVVVEMVTPFKLVPGNNPSEGVLIVTGAGGAKVRVTALSDATNVFIEYDLDGESGYELNTTKTWDTL